MTVLERRIRVRHLCGHVVITTIPHWYTRQYEIDNMTETLRHIECGRCADAKKRRRK